MKYYLAIICIMAFGSSLKAYEIKVVDGIVETSKFDFRGQKIWSTTEKDAIIANSVDITSEPITDASFIPEAIPQAELDIISELVVEKNIKSRTQVLEEIEKRNSKTYRLEKMIDSQVRIEAMEKLKVEEGLGTSIDGKISAESTELAKQRFLYDGAQDK